MRLGTVNRTQWSAGGRLIARSSFKSCSIPASTLHRKQAKIGTVPRGTIVMSVKYTQTLAQAELQIQRDPGMENLLGLATTRSCTPRARENRAYPR